MATFFYKARNSNGASIDGELTAESPAHAYAELGKMGLFPVNVEKKEETSSLRELFSMQKKPQAKELANLTRQFEVMFSAGMPVDKAIGTLSHSTSNPGLKEALLKIQKDVATGTRLASAFKKHPKYFSPLYINMIEMGQSGGILDRTLQEMAKILTKEHQIKSKVKSATMYPKIVFFVLIGVFWAMLTFVFPAFMDFYKGFNTELPLPTRIMINLSTICTSYWYIPLIFGGTLFYSYKKFESTERGKLWLSIIALRVPVFGKLNGFVANSRFGHLTSSLYRAGVSLPQALNVVAKTVDNVCFSSEVYKLKDGLEKGVSLSETMTKTKYFSPMIREACAVGEQTGRLDTVLESTAKFYDEEAEDMINNMSTLIEPIMIFFLFGGVLLLALAVYMPIWNMAKTVL